MAGTGTTETQVSKVAAPERRHGSGPNISWRDCPMEGDVDVPCPVCGATLSGNDAVNGICQVGSFIGRPVMDFITRGAAQ